MDAAVELLTDFLTKGQMPVALAIAISFLAIWVAFWTASIANRSAIIELLLDFSKRYNSQEMRDAMVRLGNWYREGIKHQAEKQLIESWYAEFLATKPDAKPDIDNSGRPNARALDGYRRDINRYFSDLIRLYDNKLIRKKKHLEMAGLHYAINVYYRVVCPMNDLMFAEGVGDADFQRDAAHLRDELGWFGDGRLSGEVPTGSPRFLFWTRPFGKRADIKT